MALSKAQLPQSYELLQSLKFTTFAFIHTHWSSLAVEARAYFGSVLCGRFFPRVVMLATNILEKGIGLTPESSNAKEMPDRTVCQESP
jgi:hypothetical protein